MLKNATVNVLTQVVEISSEDQTINRYLNRYDIPEV